MVIGVLVEDKTLSVILIFVKYLPRTGLFTSVNKTGLRNIRIPVKGKVRQLCAIQETQSIIRIVLIHDRDSADGGCYAPSNIYLG